MLDHVFVGLSRVGSEGAIWILIALLAAFYWRRPAIFIYVVLADLIAVVSSVLLREAIGRERPALRFPEPHPLVHVPGSPSFPSGHVILVAAIACVLATDLPAEVAWVPWLCAFLVMLGRVYVGAHNPLDVTSGFGAGLLVGAVIDLVLLVVS